MLNRRQTTRRFNIYTMNIKLKTAFTLIELLVVIAIVGILSGLIIVGMNSSVQSATIAKAQVFSASLRDSLLMNLVSEWKFDGPTAAESLATNSDVLDTWSGNNNCSVVAGHQPTVKSGSNCVYGNCLSFDGSTSYVNCGSGSSLNMTNAMTLEAWVKPTTLTQTNPEIICKAGGASDFRMRYVTGGSIGARFYGTVNSSTDSTPGLQAGIFTHVAIVYNGSANLIYFNSVLNTSQANSGNITATAAALFIGSNSGTGEFFNGVIDNVRIYNAAISASQIKEQYYAGLNSLFTAGSIAKEEYLGRLIVLER